MPEAEGERWRVFLATEISPALRRTLQQLLDGLEPLTDRMRVNQVERMHLTLHFLGHLPAPQVQDLIPRLAPIEGYGNGGFRFGGMSHRGSLLCLPRGMWAWPVTAPDAINEASLAPIFAAGRDIELFLIGSGAAPWPLPEILRRVCAELALDPGPQ